MAVDGIDNEVVEKGHGDGIARTGTLALLSPAGAGVVGVDSTILGGAGPLGHAGAAMGADGETRQEDGPGIGPHRAHAGIVSLELCLGGSEDGIVKNTRNGNFDHALLGMLLPGLAVSNAILPPPDIGGVGEYKVQRSDTKTSALAGLISLGIEPGDDLLDAHRWRIGPGIALKVQAEDQMDEFGFDGINRELFLDFLPALFSLDDRISQRSGCAIPKTLGGVFPHGPRHLLGIFFRRIFVEEPDHLPNQLRAWIVADSLSHGDDGHAMAAQLANGQFHADAVAIEAAEGVDEDDVAGAVWIAGALDHLLEDGPTVVGGKTGLDIFLDNVPALLKAMLASQLPLRGEADVALDLPVRADAEVEGDARRSIGGWLLLDDSLARCHVFVSLPFTSAESLRLRLADIAPAPQARAG